MRVNQSPDHIINRIQLEFLNETRTCILKTNLPEIVVKGRKIGPFKAGSKVDLPNWAIDILLNRDVAEIIPEAAYESSQRVQNLYYAEKNQPHRLQTFHPLLYAAIRQKMNRLQSDKTALDPRTYEEIERVRRMLPTLIETRLTNILRTAKSGAYKDMRKHMAKEERWLCEQISVILQEWRKHVSE